MRLFVIGILLSLFCSAQELPTISAKAASNSDNSSQPAVPVANLLHNSSQATDDTTTIGPRPYAFGGLALSKDAGYSPAAGTVGGGVSIESKHFVGLAEGSLQNAHKLDSGTGTESDLKGRAFLRTSPGWFFGGGVQWSELGTVAYSKHVWRPVFGGGKDLFRENFSMRAQALYVLPGTDHLNALQGPEVSLWMPSPASGSHFFYRQTVGIYEFHQTSVPGDTGTSEQSAAPFIQLTAMYRF
jgi:hypothetical protein